jgi:hypothetical protein
LAASRHATAAAEPVAFANLDGRTAARIAEAVLIQAEGIRSAKARTDSAHVCANPAAPASVPSATRFPSNTT